MIYLFLALILFLILFFIFIQNLYIRITVNEEVLIDIELFPVRLLLYPARKRKKRKHRLRHLMKHLRTVAVNAISVKRAVEFLLKYSSVKIHTLGYSSDSFDPAAYAVRQQNINSLISVIVTYLAVKSATLLDDGATPLQPLPNSEDAPLYFDATVRSTLFSVFLTLFVYLKERISRRKRGRKIVGHENE